MPTLDHCIANIYEPGNWTASAGTPPPELPLGSILDPANYNPETVTYSLDYTKFYNSFHLLLLMV